MALPIVKRIVCLANSRKLSERCLAGKEVSHDAAYPWIRPVSNRPTQEVPLTLRRYRDGSDPALLDLIDVPLKRHEAKSYQSENWLLDAGQRWTRAGRMTWSQLSAIADDPPSLWLNGSSTAQGLNDRVATADAEQLTESLYLLRLETMQVRIYAPNARDEFSRRVQATFRHRGVEYRLRVTDPVIEDQYLLGDDGTHDIGRCFATVSLGEPFMGYCYKLVAAVIREPPDH